MLADSSYTPSTGPAHRSRPARCSRPNTDAPRSEPPEPSCCFGNHETHKPTGTTALPRASPVYGHPEHISTASLRSGPGSHAFQAAPRH